MLIFFPCTRWYNKADTMSNCERHPMCTRVQEVCMHMRISDVDAVDKKGLGVSKNGILTIVATPILAT